VDVAAVGRDRERGAAIEKKLQELGTKGFFAACDVVNPADAQSAYDVTNKKLGKVDILVNCAGGFSKFAKVSDYTVDEWDFMLNSNLRSAFLFTRLTVPGMTGRKWGRIVNISSVGFWSPYLTSALYATAKAGMIGLTRT